ncbi:MAG: RNA polymerase sigma factor, partial [Planctomycetota bacterium]
MRCSAAETRPDQVGARRPLGDVGIPELVRRAQAGMLPCFTEVVRRFEGRLLNFVLRRVGAIDDAEDLVQETFVRAWKSIGQYNPRWQFSTWLFTIAHRLAIAHQRRRRETQSADLAGMAAGDGDPAAPIADREQCRQIWALADRILPESQRTALWLRYAEDLSTREIARVMGKSQVMVRVTLFRAR